MLQKIYDECFPHLGLRVRGERFPEHTRVVALRVGRTVLLNLNKLERFEELEDLAKLAVELVY
jgi:hypothetical protein